MNDHSPAEKLLPNKPQPDYIVEGKLLLLIDANVFLTILDRRWHLQALIESQIFENYYLICPKMIRQEIIQLQATNKNASKALQMIDKFTLSLDESLYLSTSQQKLAVDDQLILLALAIPNRVFVMTQDVLLKNQLHQNRIAVLRLSDNKARLLLPP